jgi:sirohydrochlorin ferrochelatase
MSLVRERAGQRAAGLPANQALARLADLPGFAVRAAFLDHCAPSLADVLSQLAARGVAGRGAHGHDGSKGSGVRRITEVTIVPLLLTAAYHVAIDIPAQLAAASAALPPLSIRQAAALGPHPLLLAAAERRLAQAIPPNLPRGVTSVVLAAAGSSDPQANAGVAALAARWQEAGGWRRVVPAYASAASPTIAQAVGALREASGARAGRGQVVVATYLLAPGYFADKVREQARQAGAMAVSAPLGAAPQVADVIIDRYLEAVRAPVPQGVR